MRPNMASIGDENTRVEYHVPKCIDLGSILWESIQAKFFQVTHWLDVFLERIHRWCRRASALDYDTWEPPLPQQQGGGIGSYCGVGQCAAAQDRW